MCLCYDHHISNDDGSFASKGELEWVCSMRAAATTSGTILKTAKGNLFAANPFAELVAEATDYYPQAVRPKIERLNQMIYPGVNNAAVCRSGFATTAVAYEAAYDELFSTRESLKASILNKLKPIITAVTSRLIRSELSPRDSCLIVCSHTTGRIFDAFSSLYAEGLSSNLIFPKRLCIVKKLRRHLARMFQPDPRENR